MSIIRLKPRASGIPCQCSNHWAVETLYINWLSSIWIQCDIVSLLKKFIPQFYVKQKKCGNQIFMECGNYWVNVTNVKSHVSTRTWTQCLGRNVPALLPLSWDSINWLTHTSEYPVTLILRTFWPFVTSESVYTISWITHLWWVNCSVVDTSF